MSRVILFAPYLSVVGIAVLIAGCGGSGGGKGCDQNGCIGGPGNNGAGSVVGKVVDMSGAPVPGALVYAGNGPQAMTLVQGGYRLDNVSSGFQRIQTGVTINDVSYTGSTEIVVKNGTIFSNANIPVSPNDSAHQTTISGSVIDAYGNPVNQAEIFLAFSITPGTNGAPSSDTSSLTAYTDANGRYVMPNVPLRDLNGNLLTYQMTASSPGFLNEQFSVTPSSRNTQSFQLTSSSNQGLPAPSNVAVASFTQPSQAPNAARVRTQAGQDSVYETIRLAVSPLYARLIDHRHAAARKQKLSRQVFPRQFASYAIEMDVFFDYPTLQSGLAGFHIYNSQGNTALAPYDLLLDPLANVYIDLDPIYVPDQQFNFAVSAINTDNHESSLSPAASVTPLGLLTLTQPFPGQVLFNPVTVNWNTVNGVGQYTVFVYNQFPSIGSPTVLPPATTQSASVTLPNLPSGNYWVIVAGSSAGGNEVTISQITPFAVP